MKRPQAGPLVLLLSLCGCGLIAACSGTTSSDTGQGNATEPPPSSTDAGAPIDTAPVPEADTGADGGATPDTRDASDAADTKNPVCDGATGVYPATPTPHDVLFLLDRSGSMHITVASGATRWQAAEKAIGSLLDTLSGDPAIRAGFDMFPRGDAPITCCWIDPTIDDVTCDCAPGELPTPDARCDEATYDPSLVPTGPLDGAQKDRILTAIHASDAEFYWGTPMKAGVQSAVEKQMGALDAEAIHSVVLITDGAPTSCNATDDKIDAVVAAASEGASASTPVLTFVVGVIDGTTGANAANLSKVAVAGGTPRAVDCDLDDSCFYAVNASSFESDIAKAFADIEMKAFSCTFDMPKTSGTPDDSLVNVTVTPSSGPAHAVPRDGTHADGWDFLAGKSKIQLYGDACASVKADMGSRVEIVVGCKTLGG